MHQPAGQGQHLVLRDGVRVAERHHRQRAVLVEPQRGGTVEQLPDAHDGELADDVQGRVLHEQAVQLEDRRRPPPRVRRHAGSLPPSTG